MAKTFEFSQTPPEWRYATPPASAIRPPATTARARLWQHRHMAMRYPTSFLKLLLCGLGLMSLPLFIALANAWLSLGSLTHHSTATISRAVTLTRASRTVSEELTSLERLVRQQLILDEAGVPETYTRRRQRLLEALQPLREQAANSATQDILNALENAENTIHAALSNPPKGLNKALLARFGELQTLAATLQIKQDQAIERDIAALHAQTEAARRTMLYRLLALIPILLLLTLAVVLLIQRPIRQLGSGIRRLGEGQLNHAITVRGPADLESLGRELDWLRLRLAEVDAQKTRFLRHVSHELKTPLTALAEGTQLLADRVLGPLNPEQTEITGILTHNNRRLRELIENLLDYSAIRFHPSSLENVSFPLAQLFEELAEAQKLSLQARQLTLDIPATALQLYTDRNKLRTILDNLLSNAIKYAPSGSHIGLSVALTEHLTLQVNDHGPGLPAEHARLFEPFVQGPPPSDPRFIKGTGLGLSIVRELCQALGGEIKLLPNSPQGTCAALRLPRSLLVEAPA